MGLSELVACKYCDRVFTDKGLLRHQLVKHPVEAREEIRLKQVKDQRSRLERIQVKEGIDGDKW